MPRLPIAALALSASLSAQTFDVSTIKPNAASDHRVSIMMQPGGNFRATGVNVKALVGMAYDVREFMVSGGPAWVTSDQWDIQAKSEGLGDRVPQETFRALIRSLLADRFQLKVHEEDKELPIFELVQAKDGPKLVETKEPATGRNMMRLGRGGLTANGITVDQFCMQLGQQLGRKVVNKTGLTARYDFELNWTPDPGQGFGGPGGPPPPGHVEGAPADGPSIFTAVQEKLGLKLESAKGPVKTIVIDHAAKPTDN